MLNNNILAFFNTIITLGVIDKKHDAKEKKKITLFNISCIIWYITASIQILDYLLHVPINVTNITVHFLLMLGVVIAQIVHVKQNFTLGRLLFIVLLIVLAVVFSNYFRPGRLTEFYLILVPGISFVLLNNKYINGLVFIVSLLCFALPNIYFHNYETINLHSASMVCLFICFQLMINFFIKLNAKNEQLLALERDKVLSDKIILEKQEAKLRTLNEFKTHFFVNLSHEIRTPITLIKGYVSKFNFKDSELENKQKLAIVNNQISQIEEILNSILDLSKLDENKLKLNKTTVPIVSFLNKHYADYKDLFNKKNIAFNLINNVGNVGVIMDNSLLSKAINNLLNNALKFTEASGVVSIKMFKDKDLVIQITDNGMGIPESDIDKVFNRFYQADNEITKSQGSGIGLSFSKDVIEAQGFSVTAASIPNKATTFSIKIPQKYIVLETQETEVDLTRVKTETNNILSVFNALPTKAETILIVDDHEELRFYLKTVLKDYNILEAEDGEKALKIIKSNSIDLVVTDYMMPKMDGKQLTTEIKRLQIEIPIIILTARVDEFAKLDMLRIGVDTYMIKPFIEEELLLSVKNALKVYRNILNIQNELTVTEKQELDKDATRFYKDIRKFIETRIADFNFGVEDIAAYFEISKRTLNRKTKSVLGQTAKEIIIRTKVEKARTLQLGNPEMTKKDIAIAVGINNAGYLFKKMAEYYGAHFTS